MFTKIKKFLLETPRFFQGTLKSLSKLRDYQFSFSSNTIQQVNVDFEFPVDPRSFANILRTLFIVITISLVFWLFLKSMQIPTGKNVEAPTNFYDTITPKELNHLFKRKIIRLDGIKIQGIVITKEHPENPQGYVIFEIDGKNVGPIEVGESFGKGLFLQSITKTSATITFQGQKLTLQQPGTDTPTAPPSRAVP